MPQQAKSPARQGVAGSGICRKCGYTSYACYVTSFAPLVALLSENGSSRGDFLSPLTPPYMPFGIRRFNITSKHDAHCNSQDSLQALLWLTYFFGDCPADACLGDYPVIAVSTIRCQPCKVFSDSQFLQSPLPLASALSTVSR